MEVVPSMIWIDIGRLMCETSQHCSNLGGCQLHVSHSIEHNCKSVKSKEEKKGKV